MTTIKRLQISLNIDDPFQRKIYEYAIAQGNISFYGKTLIHRDMTGTYAKAVEQVKEEEVVIDRETFESFI